MPRRALAAAVLTLTLVAPVVPLAAQPAAPSSAQAPRLWTQVHGRVEGIRGTQLTLRTDDGRRMRVDISPMSWEERQELTPGARTTLIGHVGTGSTAFVAWFLPMPETTPAASPAQPEPAEPGTPPAPPTR
jgi:hypothetical protein